MLDAAGEVREVVAQPGVEVAAQGVAAGANGAGGLAQEYVVVVDERQGADEVLRRAGVPGKHQDLKSREPGFEVADGVVGIGHLSPSRVVPGAVGIDLIRVVVVVDEGAHVRPALLFVWFPVAAGALTGRGVLSAYVRRGGVQGGLEIPDGASVADVEAGDVPAEEELPHPLHGVLLQSLLGEVGGDEAREMNEAAMEASGQQIAGAGVGVEEGEQQGHVGRSVIRGSRQTHLYLP